MKEELQFAVRVLNARLHRSDPHIGAAWPGRGLCQGSRPPRGAQYAALTQAFPPGTFLRHVGNVQGWRSRDVKTQYQDRGRGRSRPGELCQVPVHGHGSEPKEAALRSAARLAGSRCSSATIWPRSKMGTSRMAPSFSNCANPSSGECLMVFTAS